MEKAVDCMHSNMEVKEHAKQFNKESFIYKAQTCTDCGAHIWNDEIEKEYNKWLDELHSNPKKRHVFQVQYSMSSTAKECLDHLKERFPGVDSSLLTRALVMVYLEVVEDDEEIMQKIEDYIETDDYQELLVGNRVKLKIGFRPQGMKDILATADLFGVKPSKIVEDSLYRILILSINKDDKMKKFWENLILSRVEIILKAA